MTTPTTGEYKPELDTSLELAIDDTRFCQEQIGMIRWAVELGWVDIAHELCLLSKYQASPREGYIEQVLHIFTFLAKHPKITLLQHQA